MQNTELIDYNLPDSGGPSRFPVFKVDNIYVLPGMCGEATRRAATVGGSRRCVRLFVQELWCHLADCALR